MIFGSKMGKKKRHIQEISLEKVVNGGGKNIYFRVEFQIFDF